MDLGRNHSMLLAQLRTMQNKKSSILLGPQIANAINLKEANEFYRATISGKSSWNMMLLMHNKIRSQHLKRAGEKEAKRLQAQGKSSAHINLLCRVTNESVRKVIEAQPSKVIEDLGNGWMKITYTYIP